MFYNAKYMDMKRKCETIMTIYRFSFEKLTYFQLQINIQIDIIYW